MNFSDYIKFKNNFDNAKDKAELRKVFDDLTAELRDELQYMFREKNKELKT